jgi:hypothetical protein
MQTFLFCLMIILFIMIVFVLKTLNKERQESKIIQAFTA